METITIIRTLSLKERFNNALAHARCFRKCGIFAQIDIFIHCMVDKDMAQELVEIAL